MDDGKRAAGLEELVESITRYDNFAQLVAEPLDAATEL